MLLKRVLQHLHWLMDGNQHMVNQTHLCARLPFLRSVHLPILML